MTESVDLTRELSSVYASGRRNNHSWTLHVGSCTAVLPSLESASVDCVITSPPYFWQRDYDVDGQFGMEPTIDDYVKNMVITFASLRAALKPTGTVFLNLGDTYYSAKGKPHGVDAKHSRRRMAQLRAVDGPGLGLPRKSLIGIPWRVALALQDDGWTLRSDIVWERGSVLGEPTAKDRPHRKYEHIFLFTKQPRYYFNREALNGEEDIWKIETERNGLARGKHYAPYPRQLVHRCIATGCPRNGTVLDPFVGGGTTMEVALDMERDAVGVELSPRFCEHIKNTLSNFS